MLNKNVCLYSFQFINWTDTHKSWTKKIQRSHSETNPFSGRNWKTWYLIYGIKFIWKQLYKRLSCTHTTHYHGSKLAIRYCGPLKEDTLRFCLRSILFIYQQYLRCLVLTYPNPILTAVRYITLCIFARCVYPELVLGTFACLWTLFGISVTVVAAVMDIYWRIVQSKNMLLGYLALSFNHMLLFLSNVLGNWYRNFRYLLYYSLLSFYNVKQCWIKRCLNRAIFQRLRRFDGLESFRRQFN